MGQILPHFARDGSLRLAIEPLAWPTAIQMDVARRPSPEVYVRPILGGWLAKPGGGLSFELLPRAEGQRLVVAVRGLRHRLPKQLYFWFQGMMHERSTYAFLREMRRRVRRAQGPEASPRSKGLEGGL